MKHAKKLLAIVLAMLVLGSVVAVPASANIPLTGTPVITWQLFDVEIGLGVNFRLSVTANMQGGWNTSISYEWHEMLSDDEYIIIEGDGRTSIQLRFDEDWTIRTFRVVAYNQSDHELPWWERRHAVSEDINVTRSSGIPEFTTQPASRSWRVGSSSSSSFWAFVPGGYQHSQVWQERMNGQWIDVTTAQSMSHIITSEWQSRTFRVVVYNTADAHLPLLERRHTLSDEFTITRDTSYPIITQQPQNASGYFNRPITLSVHAHVENGDPVAFQWYQMSGSTARRIEGATESTLVISSSQRVRTEFRVTVYNANHPSARVHSNRAWVNVTNNPWTTIILPVFIALLVVFATVAAIGVVFWRFIFPALFL
ncbi:MAG: hypothetical protein FWD06_05130 [Oscillospiraceae bacterium]|nr:hypothetical protein [Oscillospiraceae bacterium]